jgi:pimeloyl-ACP methyl ester carboxylesterase
MWWISRRARVPAISRKCTGRLGGPPPTPCRDASPRRRTTPTIRRRRCTRSGGAGVPGDPVFDQFFASQVEDIRDVSVIERLNRESGVALRDRIGPAILLTHSQSGPFGWGVADARPTLVKGILAVEPNGPPFHDNALTGAPDWFKDGALVRPWGITRGPLTYSPAAASPEDLNMTREASPGGPGLVRCWLQGAPARKLPKLQGILILIIVSEASYHVP